MKDTRKMVKNSNQMLQIYCLGCSNSVKLYLLLVCNTMSSYYKVRKHVCNTPIQLVVNHALQWHSKAIILCFTNYYDI